MTDKLKKINNFFRERKTLVIASGIIVFTVFNIIWDVFEIKGFWHVGNVFAMFCYVYTLHLIMNTRITEFLLVLVLGQFSDEIIGNPLEINLFEYLIPLSYYLYLAQKKIRNARK